MKIPTILKGDDAGAITLALDSSHSYDGATLVVAYQGVTKTFTGLAAGGTVSLVYNHVETAAFHLGCYPMEARLIGAGGSVETVTNAEWRIKVTDIVSEVNCGGSFAVVPGAASVPVTDVEELSGRYQLADVAAKINEVCRILAQRTATVSGPSAGPFGAVALVLLFSLGAFAANVQTARLDDMYNDERVVTNVTFEGLATPGAVSNIVTKAYVEDLGISADFSTNNTELVETIEATAPAPGNYAAVSNAAVHAAITNALQDAAISTIGDSISTLSNTTSTVSSGLAALADEARPAINGYSRLYSFVTGATNANIVVTNFQLTAEAEASRTHFDPSDPDLDFSTVPPSLRLEDASSGTNRVVVDTRDWVVWYYAQKIGGAIAEAVSTAVDTCRAWCSFTATGLENPIPDTLVIDVPNIWLMAGKTFEKHVAGSNAVWIIRSSGVVMPISDNSQSAGGFLELTDAFGTPYIRFNKSESYFVDPAAAGVEYDSATGAWLVTYTTTTRPKGGANAVLEGSTTYPGKAILKDEDDPDCPATITWTGSANNWVMHAVPKQIDGAVPPKMFFAAVVEVQGQDYIEYLRPMSVPSLMFNGATYAPTVNGNKLEFIAQ